MSRTSKKGYRVSTEIHHMFAFWDRLLVLHITVFFVCVDDNRLLFPSVTKVL
jgi:hypothetical protein